MSSSNDYSVFNKTTATLLFYSLDPRTTPEELTKQTDRVIAELAKFPTLDDGAKTKIENLINRLTENDQLAAAQNIKNALETKVSSIVARSDSPLSSMHQNHLIGVEVDRISDTVGAVFVSNLFPYLKEGDLGNLTSVSQHFYSLVSDADKVRWLNEKHPLNELPLDDKPLLGFLERKGKQITCLNLADLRNTTRRTQIWNYISHCPNIDYLSLHYCGIASELKNIGDAKLLKLKRLDLSSNGILDEEFIKFLNDANINPLQELNLSNNPVTSESYFILAKSPHQSTLLTFNIEQNPVSRATEALTQKDTFGVLQNLTLNEGIMDDDLERIANADNLNSLRTLRIHDNLISSLGLISLAKSEKRKGLEVLDLRSSTLIESKGAAALANSPNFPILRSINLANNRIGSDGARAFADSTQRQALNEFDISGNFNEEGEEAALALASGTGLSSVQYLYLSDNKIGSGGSNALARSTNYPNLKLINLDMNDIDDTGIGAWAERGKSVQTLSLDNNLITVEGVRILIKEKIYAKVATLILSNNALIGKEGTLELINAIRQAAQNHEPITLRMLVINGNDEGYRIPTITKTLDVEPRITVITDERIGI